MTAPAMKVELPVDELAAAIAEKVRELVAIEQRSPWLSADEAADHLRVSRDALYKRVRAGEVPAHQDGPGCALWFHRSEIDDARLRAVR